ncbi:uncharacterized protein LOC118464569 [Anopheles albimanus]|uniref:uncharacterized protein LOC118464569 n=1 Tax=Anopheles albimanus TaxID=7167 RepID=UPI001640EF52|nr:uncharacterized protein LOC118464569 [Anopheles albimanus]
MLLSHSQDQLLPRKSNTSDDFLKRTKTSPSSVRRLSETLRSHSRGMLQCEMFNTVSSFRATSSCSSDSFRDRDVALYVYDARLTLINDAKDVLVFRYPAF